MKRAAWLYLAAGVALAAWALPRRQGEQLAGEAPEAGPLQLPGPLEAIWNEATAVSAPIYDANDARARRGNVSAFLDMLAASEGTRGAAGEYRTLYGSSADAPSLFDSFVDHPAMQSPAWPGVPLSDEQCRGAGYPPGCVSTAAGRYQIRRPTWRTLKAQLNLPDFSPASQDAAAVELLRQNGALPLIEQGRFAEAVDAVRKVWASLPGAGFAGQHENALEQLATVYTDAGGVIA